MSIEEVIAKLEEMAEDREDKILPGCLGYDEIEPLREAAALLKTHPEAQPNEPLTLEDLRKMDGKPVYLCLCRGLCDKKDGSWVLVIWDGKKKPAIRFKDGVELPIEFVLGVNGEFYRYQPKEADQ